MFSRSLAVANSPISWPKVIMPLNMASLALIQGVRSTPLMVPVSAAAAVAPLPLPLWLFCLVDLVMGWFLRSLLNRQYEAQRAGTG